MLMNNLDPEVAENPDELVVYGGTGRAARSWEAFDAIVRTLRTLDDDETLLVQSGKPVGVFRTHEWAPRVLIANSNLVPEWATWDEFRRLEALGLTMYGQMTAGSWIYIGTPGDPAGDLRVLRRDRAPPLRRVARRDDHADRRARRDGRRAAAGGDDERRRRAVRRGRPASGSSAACETRYLDEVADVARRRGRALPRAPRRERRALSVGLVRQRRRRRCRRCSTQGFEADIVTDQTSAHDPLGGYVPNRMSLRRGARAARRAIPRSTCARSRAAMAAHCAAMVGFLDARQRGVRLRQQPARRGAARRLRARVRLPGLRARLHPAAVLRGHAARSAGWRCRAIRPTSPRPTGPCSRSSPTTSRCARWIHLAAERIAFQGLPARICWLGYGERARLGLRFNELVRRGELQRPDRDRPRPPRLGLGRLALPRDRGDGRRLRRDRRLAAAQRARQHGCRRHLGVHPPRRRRRDRPLDPRRDGVRRRRHRARGRRSSSAC